jgi:hypothetical protein
MTVIVEEVHAIGRAIGATDEETRLICRHFRTGTTDDSNELSNDAGNARVSDRRCSRTEVFPSEGSVT